MREILSMPVEVARGGVNAVAGRTRLILGEIGAAVVRRILPEQADPEVLEQQDILRRYEDRFAVAGNLMDEEVPDNELDARVSWIASLVVNEGVADKQTCIEIRPLLPEDTLYDRELNARRETAVKRLSDILRNEYGIQSVFSTHPITLSDHEDSQIDVIAAWGSITHELNGLAHQIKPDPRQKVALLAITNTSYEHRVFGPQIVGDHSPTATDDFIVLRHVGSDPHDNLLLSRRPIHSVEDK